jgi:hypothetical protein
MPFSALPAILAGAKVECLDLHAEDVAGTPEDCSMENHRSPDRCQRLGAKRPRKSSELFMAIPSPRPVWSDPFRSSDSNLDSLARS